MRTVIYLDILLAVNWIVDYFLLVGTAALTGCAASRWRLLAGGVLGGASALIFLAPELPLWLQAAYQLATGTLVLLAAFRVRRFRHFAKLWAWYFLLNLCYSGLVLAAVWRMAVPVVRQNNLAFYYDVSPMLLVGCVVSMYLLLRLLLLLFDVPRSDKVVRVQAQAGELRLDVEVLIDSGMTAEDMLLSRPLLLLSWTDALGGVARSTREAELRQGLGLWFSSKATEKAQLPQGMHLVPLHTAAGPLLAPAMTAQAVINGRAAQVTLAFCEERFRAGRVQGVFGARSYEMIGGK